MLRAAEAAVVKAGCVEILLAPKEVKLWIPKSKIQGAKGVTRTLQCCGTSPCTRSCPWALGVTIMAERTGREEPLFPTASGKRVSKEQLVRAWQTKIDKEMSGHSARRSGAMMYTRAGLSVYDISVMGRWKSSAVLRYIEDALQHVPLNKMNDNKTSTTTQEMVAPGTPFHWNNTMGRETNQPYQDKPHRW